ncbi:hypothetical protein CEXT_139701 [Caerostris extrusa]|uniref:Uncharacterized protein n=1 Tax=Caerostris extrusa TaxID=172846 RepID=A0AAV4UGT5_CAEEX|nr:hypothetical protein CEXT_139701 [Caerostris extrusa]
MLLVSSDEKSGHIPKHPPPTLYKAISTIPHRPQDNTARKKAPRKKKTSNTWHDIRASKKVCTFEGTNEENNKKEIFRPPTLTVWMKLLFHSTECFWSTAIKSENSPKHPLRFIRPSAPPSHRPQDNTVRKVPRERKKTSNTWHDIRDFDYYLASIADPWRPKGLRRKMSVLEICTFRFLSFLMRIS